MAKIKNSRKGYLRIGFKGIGYKGIGKGIGYKGIGYKGIGYKGIGYKGIEYKGLWFYALYLYTLFLIPFLNESIQFLYNIFKISPANWKCKFSFVFHNENHIQFLIKYLLHIYNV